MEEPKLNNSSQDTQPPCNPQDAVHEQLLNNSSTDENILPVAETISEAKQLSTLKP